nr:Tn3 family transposase [uncultured Acidocella sp.]
MSIEAWNRILAPPAEERDMVRHYTLGHDDLALVRTKRTDSTQLGFAMQLLYLRHPGRVLREGEIPPAPILAFVARQLAVRPAALVGYGRRDATRRQHLAELMNIFGYRAFNDASFGDLVAALTPAAQIDRRPGRLISLALEELRQRRILLPPPTVIERAVHQARQGAERISHRTIVTALTNPQRQALDALLHRRAGSHVTSLAWLRTAPQSPAARNILALLDRIRCIREVGSARDLDNSVAAVVLDRLANDGMRMTSQHLAELAPARRHAVLAATVTRLETKLIDAVLFMFEKLIGSFARKAERNAEEKTLKSAADLRLHLKTLAGACTAIIAARDAGQDPIAAIEQHLPWTRFVKSVNEASALTTIETTDNRTEWLSKHATIRKFAPALLETLSFRGTESAAGLLRAIATMRETWRLGKRNLPVSVPTGFIRRSWRPFVFQHGAIDRRAYEICALWELRDRLRAGDIWVEGSRQYQALEATLIPRPSFEALQAGGPLPLAVEEAFADYIADRRHTLRLSIDTVAPAAAAGTLPDATIIDGEMKIAPPRTNVPPEAGAAREAAYSLLPRVKITDLLLEVDAWTGFSACFTHQRSGRSADDRNALLAAVLADGINLGLTRMAETCRGITLRQLAWVHDWHVREETYAAALSRLIEAHRALPIASLWGDGTTSSSDGQYFQAGGQGSGIGDINARHGNEPGVAFYTHVSDQFGPFHTKVIAATASEAPHVLDGLLYHQTGLQIAEHYTDTGGATDHVFGLCHLFGFRFAPRLRDIKDRRLYLLPDMTVDSVLQPLVGGKIDVAHIKANWNDLLRLGTSIHAGTTTASAML